MKIILTILILAQFCLAQTKVTRYEVEMLANPNAGEKDTREVNAVLIFEENALKVVSRRKNSTFREIKYSDIKFVEHSYSKTPLLAMATRSVMIGLLTGFPIFIGKKDRHWLTLLGENEFAVLKIENDNYRLIRMEFMVRDLDVIHVNENEQ